MPALHVEIQNACDDCQPPEDDDLRYWVAAAVAAGGGLAGPAELTVRIVGEEEMRALNRRYRGRDRSTNVLAFSGVDLPGEAAGPLPVGDVVICGPFAEREARMQGKQADAHLAHLLVHAVLHLLGYRHDDPAQARAMEALEVSVLAARGIADPYTLR